MLSPGGRPINEAPLSTSKTSNWVARRGGLPPYVRGIARGIAKKHGGKVTSRDIRMAIAAVKRWRATSKNPAVAAASAGASGRWAAMKGTTKHDLAKAVLAGDIDLAAVNKHHIAGTAYHWKHGYIPLDARTAETWKKKAIAQQLIREGKITTHEPDGQKWENAASRATHPLALHAVEHKKAIETPKAPEPEAPKKSGLTSEQRAAAKDYVEKYRLKVVAREKRKWDQSKEENDADEAAKKLKTLGVDVTVPEKMPEGQSKTENGVTTVTHSMDDYEKQAAWRSAHEANMAHLATVSEGPKPKGRYGYKNSDLISLRSHLGKDPEKEAVKKSAAKPDTRTAVEALVNPKKGDVVYTHPTGVGQTVMAKNKGYKEDGSEPIKYRFTGSTWQMQQKNADGTYEDATSYRKSYTQTSKADMLTNAKKVGLAANPEHGYGEVSPSEVAEAGGNAEAAAAEKRNLKLHAAAKKLGGDLPEGWTAVSPTQAIAVFGGRSESDEGDIAAAQKTLLHPSSKDTLSFLHTSGKQVRVQPGKANTEQLHGLLNTISAAHGETKHTALGDKPVVYHVKADKFNRGAWGFVYDRDTTNVHLNPELLNHTSPARDRTKVDLGKNTSQMHHTIIHEMGHVLHNRMMANGEELDRAHHKEAWEGHRYNPNAFSATDDGKNKYGAKNAHEGFAEGFSQHINDLHHSDGETHTPHLSGIAESYAQRYGWKSSSRKEGAA